MKSEHLKKIGARAERLALHFSDEARVWRMLIRTVPNIPPREASNRANDLTRVMRDVPELIEIIRALRVERTELRRMVRALQLQLAATIVEEDGAEVEREEPGIGSVLAKWGYPD